MTILALGLLLFLGVHSIRIVADPWREAQIASLGRNVWRGGFSLLSAVGFGLIIWGFALARGQGSQLWLPQPWARHITILLTLPAFVLLVAADLRGSRLRAAVRHPMLLGVLLWALAHLASNGKPADLLLFGGFLAWAAVDLWSVRRRDRLAGTPPPEVKPGRDFKVLLVGVAAWLVFGLWLHGWLIGVRPFG
ncbi:NnrU family protein [Crenobacter sp. SG2303]|uniref:NnrU family protein n=1 Tax=Crenobacter oryzisoli TaxID=3056844 RepID=A0ABT7XN92_9NEIS|nr:NnrU family protein [Crenobacter sp. SG2303]MDN0075273.1 NnrU family protein [Crenobacter sp. SG2303]